MNTAGAFCLNDEIPPANEPRRLRKALQAIGAMHYESGLLFLEGQRDPVRDAFPFTARSANLAGWLRRLNPPPSCMEVARRFPGLLSVCDAKHACPCPLHEVCGGSRVDIVRLESHRDVLGVLLLLADTPAPISRQDAERVEVAVGELSHILWNSLRIGTLHGSAEKT